MKREIQQRLTWIKLYEQTNDFGLVCHRCSISRPTHRKWWKRYQENGVEGLNNQSKRPHHSPNTKLTEDIEIFILESRKTRNLGVRRLQSELLRNYDISLSIAAIHKVLSKHQVTPVKKFRRKHEYIRYERP